MKEQTVRQMLLALDVPPFLATMAIPYVWLLPQTLTPESSASIEIYRAIQRGLNRAGYNLPVTGMPDRQTSAALVTVSGPGWQQRPLIKIIEDVINNYRNPDRIRNGGAALGSYFDYKGPAPGPLPGWMVGTPPGPLGMGATATDPYTGIELTFGKGISNPKNIVPIPRWGDTANYFQLLQRQINRLLSVMSPVTAVGEDAILGEDTLEAWNKVAGEHGFERLGSTIELAASSPSLGMAAAEKAGKLAIDPNANPGAKTTPRTSESTSKPVSKDEINKMKKGNLWFWLLAAGGVAWFASSQKKKRR